MEIPKLAISCMTVQEIALLVGGEIEGPGKVTVTGVGGLDEAREGEVVLAEDADFFVKALDSAAACIITGPGSAAGDSGKCVIRVQDPIEAFTKVVERFRGGLVDPPVGIGPGVVIESGAVLGVGVAIGANCYIGRGACIGDGSKLHPGVVIYPGCKIGKRVTLHAGVVIGADGFGYRRGENGLVKLPHVGTVEVGDDVEIGANSTIDRAKFGATVIGSGTKIDNLVHIAHNVKIGRNCVIVALSGVAGSVVTGDNVTLAAQVGVKDHVTIGDGVTVAARAGVIGDIADGATVSGFPARDRATEKRAEAIRLRLPELLERLRAVERELGLTSDFRPRTSMGESDADDGM